MLIFSFESSCDETSAAVVEMAPGTRRILSNEVISQIDTHALYGGVVPEIASRAHIEAISGLADLALKKSGASMSDIDVVGVTNRPGLIGALLVGVSFAKAFAYSANKPLCGVDHIRAHVAASYLAHPELEPPFVALVVSGGHTTLYEVTSYTDYKILGTTRDDAAGEAFDKVGRLMGMTYPCGAQMDRLAANGEKNIKFPSPALPGTLDFSFSGLKTAAINYLHTAEMKGETIVREDVAASFTAAVCSGIAKNAGEILREKKIPLVLCGGVAANSHLRKILAETAEKAGTKFYVPPISLCGDNAAMVGAQCYYEYMAGNIDDITMNAFSF